MLANKTSPKKGHSKDTFFELLRIALGKETEIKRQPSVMEWSDLYDESEKQAVSGVILHGLNRLIENHASYKLNLSQSLIFQWVGIGEMIRQRNTVLDISVVALCKTLDEQVIRYIVVKGQTLNAIYPERGIRQCGDIDFMVHPEDWSKCYKIFAEMLGEYTIDTHSDKHVEWLKDGVTYEMHRWLNDFAAKKHQRYWDEVVMKESWASPHFVVINDYKVPILSPTYNALYVFVHLFYHLINEGIGLRQFIDWYYILEREDDIDKIILKKHLEGIGLFTAYCGLGAVLTDYLGFEESCFPFKISDKEHKVAYKLIENIMEGGNFGHNKEYVHPHGVIHGLQQFNQVFKQCARFGHYAPGESWGYLWIKVKWWRKKLKRIIWGRVKGEVSCQDTCWNQSDSSTGISENGNKGGGERGVILVHGSRFKVKKKSLKAKFSGIIRI